MSARLNAAPPSSKATFPAQGLPLLNRVFSWLETFANDAGNLFNLLTGYSTPPSWQRFAVAPICLAERLLELIERERAHGDQGSIIAKMNSLSDPQIWPASPSVALPSKSAKLRSWSGRSGPWPRSRVVADPPPHCLLPDPIVEGMENTNNELSLDWSILACTERRSSDWMLEEITPAPERPVRVLLSVLDPSLRRTLAMGLRLDGHEVCESDDLVSPDECLAEGLADLVVCGALPVDIRSGKPEELIVFSGARVTQRTLIRDPSDLSRLRYLVREHREGLLEAS